jgi:hypothetical protein
MGRMLVAFCVASRLLCLTIGAKSFLFLKSIKKGILRVCFELLIRRCDREKPLEGRLGMLALMRGVCLSVLWAKIKNLLATLVVPRVVIECNVDGSYY